MSWAKRRNHSERLMRYKAIQNAMPYFRLHIPLLRDTNFQISFYINKSNVL